MDLKTFLPFADVIIDMISNKVQSKTSPELDRWVRIGAAGVKAAFKQAVVEFGLDK